MVTLKPSGSGTSGDQPAPSAGGPPTGFGAGGGHHGTVASLMHRNPGRLQQ